MLPDKFIRHVLGPRAARVMAAILIDARPFDYLGADVWVMKRSIAGQGPIDVYASRFQVVKMRQLGLKRGISLRGRFGAQTPRRIGIAPRRWAQKRRYAHFVGALWSAVVVGHEWRRETGFFYTGACHARGISSSSTSGAGT